MQIPPPREARTFPQRYKIKHVTIMLVFIHEDYHKKSNFAHSPRGHWWWNTPPAAGCCTVFRFSKHNPLTLPDSTQITITQSHRSPSLNQHILPTSSPNPLRVLKMYHRINTPHSMNAITIPILMHLLIDQVDACHIQRHRIARGNNSNVP